MRAEFLRGISGGVQVQMADGMMGENNCFKHHLTLARVNDYSRVANFGFFSDDFL
jgi:hypothetical protein